MNAPHPNLKLLQQQQVLLNKDKERAAAILRVIQQQLDANTVSRVEEVKRVTNV